MSDPVETLVEMLVDVRETSTDLHNSLDDPDECNICGEKEFYLGETDSECRVEYYAADCPAPNCDGAVSFTMPIVETEGEIPFTKRDFLDVECTECDPEDPPLGDVIERNDPFEAEIYSLPVEQLLTTDIHQHHTSYADEETIPLCNVCHPKVHQTDGFHDELKPEMSRSEWEKVDE